MNTTLLFAEILIIGVQASIWLFFLILTVFGYSWLQRLQPLGLADWQAMIVAVLLSFFYGLGIIFDRLADLAFSAGEKRIKSKVFPLPTMAITFELGKDNEYLSRQFDYTRSRMRIARASSINFGLTALFVSLFILTRLQSINAPERWAYFFSALTVGLLLTLSAVYAWYKLMKGFYRFVKANYDLYESKQESTMLVPGSSRTNHEEVTASIEDRKAAL